MDAAKIRLSAKEKRLVNDARIILTKNAIMEKTKSLMGEWKLSYDELLKGKSFTVEPASAKLSRGENYQGLPWLMLDHPRYFKGADILAIRSFFWWGRFFSITLHLAGKPKQAAEKNIIGSFKRLRKRGFSLCVNSDQWQHHMEKENYRSLRDMKAGEFAAIVSGKEFIKLTQKLELKKWEKAKKPMTKYFRELVRIIEKA